MNRGEGMKNYIGGLKEFNVYVCNCGLLLHLDNLNNDQFDYEKRKQHYCCPVCKREIKNED